jgi:uncharacterized protein YjgD (DUF1641 family)
MAWDRDVEAESGDLVGHYYEAINAAIDAERLLQAGGALEAIVGHARDEAVSSIVFIVQNPVLSPDVMAVHRERVRLYESLIRSISFVIHEGERAGDEMAEADGEALESIIQGDDVTKDD